MAKMLIPEKKLINLINEELKKGWLHKEYHCQVTDLKKVSLPNRNWEVMPPNTGGKDLISHASECDNLLNQVLDKLVSMYDVMWPEY